MSPKRLWVVGCGLLCVALWCATGAVYGQAAGEPDDVANPRALQALTFGDVDGDGLLNPDELRRLLTRAPRLQGRPGAGPGLFDRLDVDHSGALNLSELSLLFSGPFGGPPGTPRRPNTRPEPNAGLPRPAEAERPPTSGEAAFFEAKIRPALVAYCYKCHSATAEKIKGGLGLDTREGLRQGGDSGPAIVAGNLDESLLIQAIRHTDDDRKMPPKAPMPAAVIADFERWVAQGAPDPRTASSAAAARPAATKIDVEKGRAFWSFQPPTRGPVPPVADRAWPRTDIDRFLLARLEAQGMTPVGDADRRTLLRRVTFDLVGLPPTPEEVDAFLANPSPSAFESVVDRLLASPRFGERWGRHWLDVARYAESSGKQVNINYPKAWRYRDYVIDAFNDDKPYDRFIKEQVAGDLLPAEGPSQKAEQTIATGFLAIGPKSHVERMPLQFRMDLVDEQIDATTQAFLALTVACARCHDHKFDPIPQRDYYALAGIFRSTDTCYGTPRMIQNPNATELIALPDDANAPSALEPLTPAQRKQLETQIDRIRQERLRLAKQGKLIGNPMFVVQGIRLAMLQSRLAMYEPDGTPKRLAMGVRDRTRPVNSPLYVRGEVDKPGEIVPRGLVQVVSRRIPTVAQGSGRLELAEWLASADNPLTARVMVNRVWLHLFGRGLVPTADNFGAAGQPPSHPELLDYLAVSFMDEGWSVKTLIRRIVLSRAYQLDSRYDPSSAERDPDNVLVWRMSPRRLEAEAVRDAMLAVSGKLNLARPKGSPVARAGEGNSNPLMRAGAFDARLDCRSVYLPVLRNSFLESLALFDFADPSLVVAERAATTVPAQGLYLLNSPFVLRQAEALADRLRLEEPSRDGRIRRAYLRAFGRLPSEREQHAAEAFLADIADQPPGDRPRGSDPDADPGQGAWAAFCQALLASAEFLYRG